MTEGPKLAQIALNFGADDFGGILIDEVVVGATGVLYRVDKDEALRLIRGAGRVPAQRTTTYDIVTLFDAHKKETTSYDAGRNLSAHPVAASGS